MDSLKLLKVNLKTVAILDGFFCFFRHSVKHLNVACIIKRLSFLAGICFEFGFTKNAIYKFIVFTERKHDMKTNERTERKEKEQKDTKETKEQKETK